MKTNSKIVEPYAQGRRLLFDLPGVKIFSLSAQQAVALADALNEALDDPSDEAVGDSETVLLRKPTARRRVRR